MLGIGHKEGMSSLSGFIQLIQLNTRTDFIFICCEVDICRIYCINVIVPCSPSIKLFFLSMENQKGLFLQDLLHFFFVLFFNVKSKKVTFAGSDYVHHQ